MFVLHARHVFETYDELFVKKMHYLHGERQLVENTMFCKFLWIKYYIWLNVNTLIAFWDNEFTLIEGFVNEPIDNYNVSFTPLDCNNALKVSDNVKTTRY